MYGGLFSTHVELLGSNSTALGGRLGACQNGAKAKPVVYL